MYLTDGEDRNSVPPVVHTSPECPLYNRERHWFTKDGCVCPSFAQLAADKLITVQQIRALRTDAYQSFHELQEKMWSPFQRLYSDLRKAQRIATGRPIITRYRFYKELKQQQETK